jgi:hypothetical protein
VERESKQGSVEPSESGSASAQPKMKLKLKKAKNTPFQGLQLHKPEAHNPI